MEDFKRRVIIINNVAQKQYKIEDSKALNFGELKKEMGERDIPYEGLEFFEGHLGATMIDDNTALPKEIPYKGEVKSNLVFWASVAKKKFNLGARTRNECYEYIRANNLSEEVFNTFGKNFTRVSNSDLNKFVDIHSGKSSSTVKPCAEQEVSTEEAPSEISELEFLRKEYKRLKEENKSLQAQISAVVAAHGKEGKDNPGSFISDEEIKELFSGRV